MMSEARPQLVLLQNRGIERPEYRITKQERDFATAPGRRYERFGPRTLPLSIADRTFMHNYSILQAPRGSHTISGLNCCAWSSFSGQPRVNAGRE
jgi:hypothetical protein